MDAGGWWTYDADADVLFIRFRPGRSVRQVEDGKVVYDLNERGDVIGIEILSPYSPPVG